MGALSDFAKCQWCSKQTHSLASVLTVIRVYGQGVYLDTVIPKRPNKSHLGRVRRDLLENTQYEVHEACTRLEA